jgi:hypothetical protein
LSWFGNHLASWLNLDNRGYGGYYTVSEVGRTTPIIIDQKPLQCYKEIAHFQVVVNKNAEMLSNGIWKHVDSLENEIEDSPYVSLLNNPNQIQGKSQFLSQISINYDVLANSFIKSVVGLAGEVPQALYVLPAQDIEVVPSGKLYEQYELDAIISKYTQDIAGVKTSYKPEEILHIKQPGEDVYKGISKVEGLRTILSNLVGALEARNVLITNRGAIGIISPKDGKSLIGLSPQDKKDGEKKLINAYGNKRGQRRIQISDIPVEYHQMGMKVSDLMLFEEEQDAFYLIIDAYGQHKELFSNNQTSRLNNSGLSQEVAQKNVYQNNIIPFGAMIANNLTPYLFDEAMLARGERLILSFDHLDILKENNLKESQSNKLKAETIAILAANLEAGIISQEQFDEMMQEEEKA